MPALQKVHPLALAGAVFTCHIVFAQAAYLAGDYVADGVKVFLPAGINVAVLIATSRRRWPSVIVAIALAECALDAYLGYAPHFIAGFVLANLAQPIIGALLVQRAGLHLRMFDAPGLFVRTAAILATVGPMVGALCGVTTLAMGAGPQLFWAQLPNWYLGDAFGALLGATALLAIAGPGTHRASVTPRRLAEQVGLVALLTAVTLGVFLSASQPLGWLVIPLVLTIAYRGGIRCVGVAMTMVILIAEGATAAGRGLVVELAQSKSSALDLVQGYLVVVLLCGVLLAVETSRRQHLQVLLTEAERAWFDTELLRSRRLEAVGQLAGGLAHDFNNLLGVVRNYAELVARDATVSTDAQRDLALISAAAERGGHLVHRLLDLGRADGAKATQLDLAEVVQSLVDVLRGSFTRHELDVQAPTGALVLADRVQIEQLLMNLLFNARDAMAQGGQIVITVSEVEVPPRAAHGAGSTLVQLEVRDNGAGMAPEVLNRVFEPFFTTKSERHSSGFGLATVRSIVEAHRGTVGLSSKVGVGTTVTVRLPAAVVDVDAVTGGAPVGAAPSPYPAARDRDVDLSGHLSGDAGGEVDRRGGSSGAGGVILVVDDDPSTRRSVTELLRRDGFTTVSMASGSAALDALASGALPDLILTDVVMAPVGGIELADTVRTLYPDVPVVLMSGDPGLRHRELGWPLLGKPMVRSELQAELRRALHGVH